MILVQKLLDTTSGSVEFKSADNTLTYKLTIEGTPLANVKVFYVEENKNLDGFFLKINCDNWNNSFLKLYAKSPHVDDDFTETGDIFLENELKLFYY